MDDDSRSCGTIVRLAAKMMSQARKFPACKQLINDLRTAMRFSDFDACRHPRIDGHALLDNDRDRISPGRAVVIAIDVPPVTVFQRSRPGPVDEHLNRLGERERLLGR